ncbi:MAG: YfcC family protein [Sedimentibacter sp.]
MKKENQGIQISMKSFLSSAIILLVLMIASGMLTRILPPGQYDRIIVEGRETIDVNSFEYIGKQNYPFYRWFTAPVEVLWSDDSLTVIVIILFILFIGGTFTILEKSGIIKYAMDKIVGKFSNNKYLLMSVLILFFMAFGSIFGIFEELIALVPICVTLSYSLGWDSLVGLGMSALASGFGFAAAIFNPFTVGVAQELAGLPPFSGFLYRILIFAIIYFLLLAFLLKYARKIEKNPELSMVYEEDKLQKQKYYKSVNAETENPNLPKAIRIFTVFLIIILLFIMSGFFVDFLSAITLPVVAVLFLIGGLLAGHASRYSNGRLVRDWIQGLIGIAPSVILILMAMSVKVIITNGKIMDTILYYAFNSISNYSPYVAGLLLYLLVLVLEFFVGSASAKAFLVIPIIIPITDMIGITRQAAVQAFCFGDGFSNMLFPTNAALMIALGLTPISYLKWFKWVIKLQLAAFVISLILLFIAIGFGYGPY